MNLTVGLYGDLNSRKLNVKIFVIDQCFTFQVYRLNPRYIASKVKGGVYRVIYIPYQ